MEKLKKASYAKLEKDFNSLKNTVLFQYKNNKSVVSLQGSLKKIKIGENDIEKAKKSLFGFGA